MHHTCFIYFFSFSLLSLSPARGKHELHRSHSHLCRVSLQIVKVWSEDGAGKVVEIPADMTARDVCQLLVYKSHCVDDNAWTLVEHHPVLGLGRGTRPGVALTHRGAYRANSKFLPL